MRVPAKPWRLALVLIGVAFIVFVILGGSFRYYEDSGGASGALLTEQQLARFNIGRARDDIEAELGPGEDALGSLDTGAAVEPIDAECRYYDSAPEFGVVQLCYRDGELVSKRSYELPPPGE